MWVDSEDHLGWWPSDDDRWVLGVAVESGRVRDRPGHTLRAAFREIVAAGLVTEVRLTARQDVLLCGVAQADRATIDAILDRHGVVPADAIAPIARHAMACPALPTCGQALGEAERVMPGIVEGISGVVTQRGLGHIPLRVNVTGCPNGCARPYTSEIGIVGRSKTTYDVYVGGSVGGDRLNDRVAVGVKLDAVPGVLAPLVDRWQAERKDDEGFGDFCHRVGADELRTLVPVATPRRRATG